MYEMKSNRNEQYITPCNHKINRVIDLWTLFPTWYIIKKKEKEGKKQEKNRKKTGNTSCMKWKATETNISSLRLMTK
jgi:hypothetical protein